jgi:hypothetical protein
MSTCHGSALELTDCSRQVRFGGTSPEYWSGWVLRLACLEDAENHLAVMQDNIQSLRSTTKWLVGLRLEPPEPTNSCPNFNY